MRSSLWPVRGDAAEILTLLRAWDIDPGPPPLMIETSGSTGQPKQVVVSRRAMRASAEATHRRLGGPGEWVLNLPPTYVAGVQVLYRSVVAGIDPTVMGPQQRFAELRPAARRFVSLVPTQVVRLLGDDSAAGAADLDALAACTAVLVGGGPLDPAVRRAGEQRGLRIVATYGMSETCGGCVYDGEPLDGVEIRIDDGEVLLRGPMLFERYQGDPARTAAAFRDGWLVTGDLGHRAADGRLRIDGRRDDIIISGGINVPGAVVAAQLGDGIEVVGVPDAEWGERVVAVVTEPVPLDELRDRVTPREWAPRQVVVVPQIPRLANGKPDRLAMRRLAADA